MKIDHLGQIPISPENPSGEDVRYEPEYEEMQAEIEKLSSPSSQGATDWKKVVELSTSILSEKSKNVLVASYLCAALLHTQGPQGLAPSVSMYRGLIENFWDTLYPPPKRKKARLNAIEWWLDRNLDVLDNLPEDFTLTETAQKALNDDIDALDAFLGEQTDDAPMLYQLKNRIKNITVVPDPQTAATDTHNAAESASPEVETPSSESDDKPSALPEAPTALPLSPEDEAIVNLGLIPISPEAPSGEDVRYEPEYEEMQEEIEKLSSPSNQDAMDWNKVLQLTKIILSEKSKNILVASYLCAALLHTRGPEGLAPGLNMYRGIVENFWDTLFPPKKRKKARFNAIDWWLERNLNSLENIPDDFKMTEAAIQALNDDVDALDAFLAAQTDDAPMLYQLKNRFKNIPLEIVAPPPEKKPEPAPAAKPKPQAQSTPKPKPKPAAPKPSVEEEEIDENSSALLEHGLDRLGKAAALFIENEPSNAMAYRLGRLAAWLEVDGLPPADNGQTMIPPPMEEFTDVIDRLYENNNYENLVEAAESRIGQYLFWLDLSRYSSEALAQLGFQEARETVDEETARYVQRLPGIENLAFSDGRPFADAATLSWLRDIAADQGDGEMTGGGDSDALVMAETYSQAQGLARDKKLPEALEMLQKCFREAGSEKARLMGRINIARLLISARKPRLALPHWLDIIEKMNTFGTECWDPDFALKTLTAVFDGLKAQQDEALQEQIAGVLNSISKLSPVTALRLAG